MDIHFRCSTNGRRTSAALPVLMTSMNFIFHQQLSAQTLTSQKKCTTYYDTIRSGISLFLHQMSQHCVDFLTRFAARFLLEPDISDFSGRFSNAFLPIDNTGSCEWYVLKQLPTRLSLFCFVCGRPGRFYRSCHYPSDHATRVWRQCLLHQPVPCLTLMNLEGRAFKSQRKPWEIVSYVET